MGTDQVIDTYKYIYTFFIYVYILQIHTPKLRNKYFLILQSFDPILESAAVPRAVHKLPL